MLFDTDVLIGYLRGHEKAAECLEKDAERCLSVISYMELLQGARNKQEIRVIRSFLKEFNFRMLPATENIGHRASVYMEEYCLKVEMCVADALLAATAAENHLTFCTANTRHYKLIREIELKEFKP